MIEMESDILLYTDGTWRKSEKSEKAHLTLSGAERLPTYRKRNRHSERDDRLIKTVC